MKRIFLIDYENVESAGLEGFGKLSDEDAVEVFYTEKANRINIDFVDGLLRDDGHAKIFFTKVATGNQALDLQLATYLGGLIMNNDRKYDEFVIVSKDKGYAVIQKFWKQQKPDIELKIRHNLAVDDEKADANEPPAEKKEEPKNPVKPRRPRQQKKQDQVKPETQPEENKDPVEKKAEEIKTDPVKQEPVKTEVSKPEQPRTQQNEKSLINSRIQQTLSKTKSYAANEINVVASIAAKYYAEKNGRQIIYREIIKKFGQKRGLELYGYVKDQLGRIE